MRLMRHTIPSAPLGLNTIFSNMSIVPLTAIFENRGERLTKRGFILNYWRTTLRNARNLNPEKKHALSRLHAWKTCI